MFTKFYGLDWLLFIFIVIHIWMLGQKMRAAFLFGVAGACAGFVLGWVIWSAGTLTMNVVFALLHIRAYVKWKEDESGVDF